MKNTHDKKGKHGCVYQLLCKKGDRFIEVAVSSDPNIIGICAHLNVVMQILDVDIGFYTRRIY